MDPVRCATEPKSELVDSCSPIVGSTFDCSPIQRHGRGLCRETWTGFPHAWLRFASLELLSHAPLWHRSPSPLRADRRLRSRVRTLEADEAFLDVWRERRQGRTHEESEEMIAWMLAHRSPICAGVARREPNEACAVAALDLFARSRKLTNKDPKPSCFTSCGQPGATGG